MDRRNFLKLSWGLIPFVGAWASRANAQQVPTLRDTLVFGLQASQEAQLAFIDKVVNYVNQEKLELSLVLAAFKYARPKKPQPYPYFEAAMKQLAAREGVTL